MFISLLKLFEMLFLCKYKYNNIKIRFYKTDSKTKLKLRLNIFEYLFCCVYNIILFTFSLCRCATRSHGPRAVPDSGRPFAAELFQTATAIVEPKEDELVRKTVADIGRRRVRGFPVDGCVGSGWSRGLY